MSLAVEAGLTLREFYDCECWELSVILSGYNDRRSEELKNNWEQARFIRGGMSDTSKIKFPWEQKKITKEIWEVSRKHFKQWAENHNKRQNKD